MEYLEEVIPQVAVMTPQDPLRRGYMRALMRFIDEMPAPAIRVPSYNLAFLPRLQKMTKEEFLTFAESKAAAQGIHARDGAGQDFQKRNGCRDGPAAPHGRFAWTTERKERRAVATGREISLADVSVMPVIVRLADLPAGERLWQDKPAIARWLENIRAHPAYAKTYYHGTHLTELYPHLQDSGKA